MEKRARSLGLKLAGVLPFLNEKQRRVLAAAEAKSYGRGGIQTIARITGMCRQTIYRGLEDLKVGNKSERVRKPGGGRKKLSKQSPEMVGAEGFFMALYRILVLLLAGNFKFFC